MRLPTLRDILGLPAFRSAELLSGASRLDCVIAWVHTAEVLDVWRFLSGGELILTTGLELARADSKAQENYLRALAEAGAHGLAIELVQSLRAVPDGLLKVAQHIEFPLMVFREEVGFADLTRAAHQLILRPNAAIADEPVLDSLFEALMETGRAERFLDNQLGNVLCLPSRAREALLRTLEALLASQFNVAQAARKLGLRRQSIYYRLDQIHGLLGVLDAPERRAGLWVALALLQRKPFK